MQPNDRTVGLVTLGAALTLLGVGLAADLSPTGAGLTFIGVIRLCFLAALVTVARTWRTTSTPSRLRSLGTLLVTLGAPLTVAAALAHGLIGGWDFDPFEDTDATPPWYSVVVGLGAVAFAVGSILIGLPHLRDQRTRATAMLLVAAGVFYLPAIPLGGFGHAIWALPWLGIGAVLASTRSAETTRTQVPAPPR